MAETRQTYQELFKSYNLPIAYVGDALTRQTARKFLQTFMSTPPKGTMTDKTERGREALQNQEKLKERAIIGYKKLFGKDPLLDGNRAASPFFFGPPGQGKTQTYHDTGELLADVMGMNFVLDPGIDSYIDRNSFVLTFIDSSGASSSLDSTGVPYKDILKSLDSNSQEIIGHVMNMMLKPSLEAIGRGGCGILIPDDIGNYSEAVQTAYLSVAWDRKLGEHHFPSMCVGFASNLGKMDKTAAKEINSALLSRCSVTGVLNTPEDVYKYIKNRMVRDQIDATPYLSALKRHELDYSVKNESGNAPAYIHLLPEPGKKSGSVNPRTIVSAWKEMRHIIHSYDNLSEAMTECGPILEQHLGKSYGHEITNSMEIYARGAAPIADKLINQNTWDEEAYQKGMQGAKEMEANQAKSSDAKLRLTAESKLFLQDLAMAFVDEATNRALKPNPEDKGKNFTPYDKDTLLRFFKGLSQLDRVPGFPTGEFVNLAITEYFSLLPLKLGENSEYVKDPNPAMTVGTMLNSDTRLKIVQTVSKFNADYVSQDMFNCLKNVATYEHMKTNAKAREM
jgi:hypothetical protein